MNLLFISFHGLVNNPLQLPFRERILLSLVLLTPYFCGLHTCYICQRYEHRTLKTNRDSPGVDDAVVYYSE